MRLIMTPSNAALKSYQKTETQSTEKKSSSEMSAAEKRVLYVLKKTHNEDDENCLSSGCVIKKIGG
jgi:hypothetical protein